MKLIVAGGRDYKLNDEDYHNLAIIHWHCSITEIVSGGASGADKCGEIFAASRKLPVKVFPADWKKHGRKAGPLRNKEMAEYADAVALFPGGRGTASMKQEAEKAGIDIFDYRGQA